MLLLGVVLLLRLSRVRELTSLTLGDGGTTIIRIRIRIRIREEEGILTFMDNRCNNNNNNNNIGH